MSAKTNYFKIGLFVLIGGVVFVLALIAFGLRGYFEENTLYETYIDTDVEGLSIGSPVNFRGVNVGKVTWIGFPWARYPKADQTWVVVEFELRDNINPRRPDIPRSQVLREEVNRGLRARVKSQGILK